MTDQLILAVVALLLVLVLLFEAEETWRWRGSENRPQSRFRIVRFFRRVVGGVLAIFTLRRSSGRHTSKSDPAPMASEDVARRLGTADAAAGPVHIAPQRIVVSGPHRVEAPPPPVPLVVPPLAVERSSRLRLLRDTVGATLVLIGFVVVAINVVIPPQSPNPQPSGGVLDGDRHAPGHDSNADPGACRVGGRDRLDGSGAVADPDDPRLIDAKPDADRPDPEAQRRRLPLPTITQLPTQLRRRRRRRHRSRPRRRSRPRCPSH